MVPTRRRLAPEARRRHLIETALGVFARQRYDETELEEVAVAAGVQRPLIYHYFPGGKRALYLAVVEHALQLLVAQLDVSGEAPAPSERLPENLARYLDLVEDDNPAIAIVRQAQRLEEPDVIEVMDGAATAVAAGIAHNQLHDDEPDRVVLGTLRAFVGFFDVLVDEWQAGRLTRADVEAIVEQTLPAVAAAGVRAAAA